MLAPFLDRFTQEELDALPFGVVQLDRRGRVLSINQYATAIADWNDSAAVGLDFFAEVCPAMRVADIVDRMHTGFASDHLDEMFPLTVMTDDGSLQALIRMYYASRTRTMWVFSANPDGSPYRLAA